MKNFAFGVILGCLITGCAGAGIAWQYYGLQAVSYNGKLLAVDPKNDKDLSYCQPTPYNKSPCVVMTGADFYAFKQDYLDKSQQLSDCQRKCN